MTSRIRHSKFRHLQKSVIKVTPPPFFYASNLRRNKKYQSIKSFLVFNTKKILDGIILSSYKENFKHQFISFLKRNFVKTFLAFDNMLSKKKLLLKFWMIFYSITGKGIIFIVTFLTVFKPQFISI